MKECNSAVNQFSQTHIKHAENCMGLVTEIWRHNSGNVIVFVKCSADKDNKRIIAFNDFYLTTTQSSTCNHEQRIKERPCQSICMDMLLYSFGMYNIRFDLHKTAT